MRMNKWEAFVAGGEIGKWGPHVRGTGFFRANEKYKHSYFRKIVISRTEAG